MGFFIISCSLLVLVSRHRSRKGIYHRKVNIIREKRGLVIWMEAELGKKASDDLLKLSHSLLTRQSVWETAVKLKICIILNGVWNMLDLVWWLFTVECDGLSSQQRMFSSTVLSFTWGGPPYTEPPAHFPVHRTPSSGCCNANTCLLANAISQIPVCDTPS